MSGKNILNLLRQLMAAGSISGTACERTAEAFLESHLASLPYFQKHPRQCGFSPVPGDPFGRGAVYGLVRGVSAKTVILINHHDVVDTACYGSLQPLACDMDAVTEALKVSAAGAAGADFRSGQWLGGRGSCDMKGGAAAQLDLLAEYSAQPGRDSLLFLSVPDEETFSAGMRHALTVLEELRAGYGLDYRLAVNCEPNRREGGTQVIPCGSVGKLLPVVYIKGKSVHVSDYENGLNPLGILAALVASTEGLPGLREDCEGEKTVPPVWMFMRDRKQVYDFSLPDKAAAYCTVQAFARTPQEIFDLFRGRLLEAIADFRRLHPAAPDVPVKSFSELLREAGQKNGFAAWQEAETARLHQLVFEENVSYPDATLIYIEDLLAFMEHDSPLAVLTFSPPYYPAVRSEDMGKPYFENIKKALAGVMQVRYEPYFLGVSDCSYCGTAPGVDHKAYIDNTPLWGSLYSFDEQLLSQMQIPFMLLGPWGKDLHEATERVHIKSLTEELPRALAAVCSAAWEK